MKLTGRIVAALLIAASNTASPIPAAPIRAKQFQAEYRRILGVVAAGEREQALSELVALETGVVGDKEAWRYVDNIWRIKLGVIRELLEVQPVELLRPIILLHHDAYFEYVELGRRYLAGHSRQMAAELAEVYLERAGTPQAAVFSGWVLTSLGAYLWSPNSVSDSAELFYRAQVADPGNLMAVLGLSAAYEKKGEYKKAIQYLNQALQYDPGNIEAQLRWILCQLRGGFEPETTAQQQLQELAGPTSPSWIRSIAFQEIARIQIHGDDLRGAEATLRSGLAALPGDQDLSLQLAAVLERQGHRSEGLDIVETITAAPNEESPRERYDFWVPQGIEEARAEFLGEERDSLAALGAGLSAVSKEGE